MDAAGFERAVHQLREQITCPEAAVAPELAVRVHLVMALDAFTDREPERAREAFRAMLAIDPDWSPPASLAPRGNPLRELFDAAQRDDPALGADLAEPTVGSFYVDGRPATERPSDRPFVLQWIDEHGNARWSDWLPAGAHLPIEVLAAMHEEDPMDFFEQAPPPPPRPVDPVAPAPLERGGKGASVALLAGAGGAALASGGLLVAALVSRGQWQSAVDECVTWGGCEEAPDAALREHQELAQRARTLGYAAQGGAGLALGLGIAGGLTLVW
jgi:hypothetical protein